jgi:hypothetical protein
MTKTEAAEYLGMSERSLERHTKDNKIGVRYERGKTKPVPFYDAGELDRFKAELETPVHRPAVEKMPPGSDNGANVSAESGAIQLARPEEFLQVIESVINATAREVAKAIATGADNGASKRQTPNTLPENKLLLSLDEAAALTGLSAARLRLAIGEEKLVARKVGRAWKMRRGDVERFVDSIFGEEK